MHDRQSSAPLIRTSAISFRKMPNNRTETAPTAVIRKAIERPFIAPPRPGSAPAVGVQAGEDEVDAEVAHDRCKEPDDGDDGGTATVPPPRDPGVEEERV